MQVGTCLVVKNLSSKAGDVGFILVGELKFHRATKPMHVSQCLFSSERGIKDSPKNKYYPNNIRLFHRQTSRFSLSKLLPFSVLFFFSNNKSEQNQKNHNRASKVHYLKDMTPNNKTTKERNA